MEFGVLGKLVVDRDGDAVDLGAHRQRALLGLLLTAPNVVFPTDRIIDELWGADAGPDKQNALWVHVSGLRTALEPEREKRSEGTVLLTRAPGYVVEVGPGELDSLRFEHLISEGRSLVDTDPAAASLVLGEALGLWRGRAFEDFTYESWSQPEIARLEALRLEAVEARIDADLRRGLSRELTSELESLVRSHPLHEGLTAQLMIALARAGRQADALRAYAGLNARLGSELGLEPSTRLRELEHRIITADPDVAPRPTTHPPNVVAEPGLAVRGYELRERLGARGGGVVFRAYQPGVGREVAIKVFDAELADDPVFIREFEADAQLAAGIEHPHVVPIYDYWREPGAAYLVMRLMRGGTLADAIESGAVGGAATLRLVEQIGGALESAHRAGLTHGAVEPRNVLLDGDHAYLADFGVTSSGTPHRAGPAGPDSGAVAAPLDPASDIAGLAVCAAQALTGTTGAIGELRGALPPAAQPVIDRAVGSDPHRRYTSVETFVGELRSALTSDAAPADGTIGLANPYKGLRAFDRSDVADFFGRERLVERLVSRLREPGPLGCFVAVVGPSGSGKSSLVKAGLLPAIRRGATQASTAWYSVEMLPAPHPFEQLAEALCGVAVDPPLSLLEHLEFGRHGLRRAVDEVLPTDDSHLVVAIDQFEELFTQVEPSVADRFVDTLVDAVTDTGCRVRIVVTLRADFYDRPLRHRGLGELLGAGTEVITLMSPDELQHAITAPAARLGVTFEPALVAELVRDVADRAGALPLLQYTLTELFDERRGARIFERSYRELGGVSGALVKRAEGLVGALGDDATDITRQAFLRMVTLREGTSVTRRRVMRLELEQLHVDRRRLDAVLDTFGRHRLLSFDRDPVTRSPTVEISHEALLVEWGRLRDWIDRARHDVRNQRRLAEAMGEWVTAGRSPAYLLRGGRLQQMEGWAATSSLPLSVHEQEFLDASVAERERALADERDRERRATSAERRARRRVRQLAALAVAAALITGLAVFGFYQWREAQAVSGDLEALVRASYLAERSVESLDADAELSLLLAVAAIRSTVELGYATEDAIDAVHWALQAMRVPYDLDAGAPVAVRPGPGGLAGVYLMSPSELVSFAERVTDRRLTQSECRRYGGASCDDRTVPDDLAFEFGEQAYLGDRARNAVLRGTTVTFSNGYSSPGLAAELARFEDRTGIVVRPVDFEFARDLASDASRGVAMPDVAETFWLGELRHHVDRLRPIDVSIYLDEAQLERAFGDYVLDLGRLDGSLIALPIDIDPKALVVYPRAAFEAARYSVPGTWAELMELSRRMVADGRTPWCLGFRGSGFADGWPGTDLLEATLLGSSGADVYDDWVNHRIAADDPAAVAAAAMVDELLLTEGFTRSPSEVAATRWDEVVTDLVARDPGTDEIAPRCWMSIGMDQLLRSEAATTVTLGTELDVFPMPGVAGEPVRVGGASFVTALNDRPEVRAFLEFLTSSDWGVEWARTSIGEFVSPHRLFSTGAYGSALSAGARDVVRRIGQQTRDSIDAGAWRYDGSDQMPPTIGSRPQPGRYGVLVTGMMDVARRTRTVEQLLADVEAAWSELATAATEPRP